MGVILYMVFQNLKTIHSGSIGMAQSGYSLHIVLGYPLGSTSSIVAFHHLHIGVLAEILLTLSQSHWMRMNLFEFIQFTSRQSAYTVRDVGLVLTYHRHA